MTVSEAIALLPPGCADLGNTRRLGAKTHDPNSQMFRAPSGEIWRIKWLPHKREWSDPCINDPLTEVEKERLGM